MSEKIRKLTNSIVLGGKLLELETKRDVCESTINGAKQKVDYISLKGVIQFGDSEVQTRRFESFIKKKTAKGEESKLYSKFEEFANDMIPATKNVENASYVELSGSLVANDYVNVENQLIETQRISMQFIRSYGENKGNIDIEGYIQAVREEVDTEGNLTGRLKFDLISTDFYNQALVLKNIVIPQELASPFSENYEIGQTAVFHIDFVASVSETPVSTSGGGIGVQRSVTDGKSHLEMVLVGADSPYTWDEDDESCKALSPELVRNLLNERTIKLDQIKNDGYLGNKTPSSSGGSGNRTGIGASSTKNSAPKTIKSSKASAVEDDDDMPF